jgi:PAS domain S-box-containing protein
VSEALTESLGVRVAIVCDDESRRRQVSAEIEREGGEITAPTQADLLIVDGESERFATRMRAAIADNPRLAVMALLAPTQLADLPGEIEELVVTPLVAGEVGARARLWARRQGARGTTTQRLLALAVEGAADVVEIADPQAVLSYVNPAFTELLGYSAEEAVGRTPAQLMRSSMHSKEYFAEIDRTLRAGEVWKGLLISRAKDGRLVHFDATVSPILDRQGKCTHHLAVKRDITERLAAEARLHAANEELQQARDAALEASRVKGQFLANMSHELRTPLNAIIGYSELIAEEAEDLELPSLGADADKIRAAGRHLLGLINDILDISKIEAGKVELFVENVRVADLLAEVAATIAPLASERRNEIVVDDQLPIGVVRADLTRLKQILFNLVSNANKFTEMGKILVEARLDPADDGAYLFAVSDTGIGMTSEQIGRLFKPFVQADASTTRRYGGTGLGLTISQRFCELMGGYISVRSELGVGSTFTVRLPLSPGSELELSPDRAASFGRRVLVIDDDPALHDLLLRTLEPAGFEVTCVRSGEAGLERARADRPDVVILDVVMPTMDGWSVLTALKKDPLTQTIPVVMLTFLKNCSAGLALGASDYLVKPVETSRLVQIVRSYCGALPATVLVVEDDVSTRELVRRVLTGAGHAVREARNGREGLELLERQRPDVILLDLMMPEVDGFTFLDRLRAREEHRDIPVVVVTAKLLDPDDRLRLAGAAHQIIRKGDFSSQELMSAVLRQVSNLLRRPGA